MDNSLLVELTKTAPAAVAVIIVVWIFVRAMGDERKTITAFFKTLHQEHLDARSMSREAIQENSQMLKANIEVTAKNTQKLEEFSKAIDRFTQHQRH